MKELHKPYIFLLIAFIEGGAVMACELLGAKMTAPFFGTTLYSWAGVLAITLGGLAIGYYLGGHLSAKFKPPFLLQIILISTGLFMVLMPLIAVGIMKTVIELELMTGLLISLTVFLLPPVILFGMVSPIIVAAMVNIAELSGKITGRVYAVSTIGGVISTLFLGFYIIPTFGIKWPSISYGILLLLTALLFVVIRRKALKAVVMVTIIAISLQVMANQEKGADKNIFRILSSSEGLLGQVKVADYGVKTEAFGVMPVRGLLVNNTWQTVANRENGTPLLDYIYFMRPIFSGLPKRSNVLLVGLGGGSLCNEIQQKGHKVDVVELDPRLPRIAKRYFGVMPDTKIITDDGRHFIRTNNEKYQAVILDVFLGENQPWHLLTLESFREIKNTLTPDGRLLIEFNGFLKGANGQATRSLYMTLKEAGFIVDVIATDSVDGIQRNFIFVAGESHFNFDSLSYDGIKYTDKKIDHLKNYLIPETDFESEDYVILTDDMPALEFMLLQPAIEWRKELNVHFRDRFVALGQPLFY